MFFEQDLSLFLMQYLLLYFVFLKRWQDFLPHSAHLNGPMAFGAMVLLIDKI